MVGGVEWANLEVRACVVFPALHQVELSRDIMVGNRQVKRMQVYLRSKCWDLNAFHSDLVGRVVRACDGFLPVEHRHLSLEFGWSLQMSPGKLPSFWNIKRIS